MDPSEVVSRRRLLRQSFAFSALAGLGALPSFASSKQVGTANGGSRLLMVGDWGYENFEAQSRVAKAMQAYVHGQGFTTEALLMLGDNWYGPLPGGVKDVRWQTQFEEMYPKRVFDCPAYAIAGNHDPASGTVDDPQEPTFQAPSVLLLSRIGITNSLFVIGRRILNTLRFAPC